MFTPIQQIDKLVELVVFYIGQVIIELIRINNVGLYTCMVKVMRYSLYWLLTFSRGQTTAPLISDDFR